MRHLRSRPVPQWLLLITISTLLFTACGGTAATTTAATETQRQGLAWV